MQVKALIFLLSLSVLDLKLPFRLELSDSNIWTCSNCQGIC
jgi:hypothetical protein